MLSVTSVKDSYRDLLGATTHANGTSRVQLLKKNDNPLLHTILTNFGKYAGVEVLLNTSFNRRGEPMVASPKDAVLTFGWSGLDFLVIGNFIVSKDF